MVNTIYLGLYLVDDGGEFILNQYRPGAAVVYHRGQLLGGESIAKTNADKSILGYGEQKLGIAMIILGYYGYPVSLLQTKAGQGTIQAICPVINLLPGKSGTPVNYPSLVRIQASIVSYYITYYQRAVSADNS